MPTQKVTLWNLFCRKLFQLLRHVLNLANHADEPLFPLPSVGEGDISLIALINYEGRFLEQEYNAYFTTGMV